MTSSEVPTYSIGPDLSQATNLDQAAAFVRAPGPGPDGSWGTDDDDRGDMRLVAGSAGIDAGNSRIGNGTVDMGAAER